jgi:hypothetical protein
MRVIPIKTRRGRKPAVRDTQKSAKTTAAKNKTFGGFTDEERAAMKEHVSGPPQQHL